MPDRLTGKRVVVLVEDLYEDLELWYPLLRLREAGAQVVVAGPQADTEYKSKHGYPCRSERAAADLRADDFDGVVIPGGYAPDRLRRYEAVNRLVADLAKAGKLVAFICHAGWVPISAGVVDGVRLTSFSAIKDDLVNAGARFEDAPVVVDGGFVSSRTPADLTEFVRGILQVLGGQKAKPGERSAAKAGRR